MIRQYGAYGLLLLLILVALTALATHTTTAAGSQLFAGGFGPEGYGAVELDSAIAYDALAVQPDGGYLVAGQKNGQFYLARHGFAGPSDQSFGDGGSTSVVIGASSGIKALALTPTGQIVAAGYGSDAAGNQRFALARHRPDGRLDQSFGAVTVGFDLPAAPGRQRRSTAEDVQIGPDGRIFAVGSSYFCEPSGTCDSYTASIAALLPSGALDPGFGQGGKVQFAHLPDSALSSAALQADGKLIVAGRARLPVPGRDQGLLVARLLPDGRPDPSFGQGGQRIYADTAGADSILARPDGSIIVLAHDALLGLRPDGQIDPAFGTAGRVGLDLDGGVRAGQLVALPDGRLLVSFVKGNESFSSELGLLRLLPDGSPDHSFGFEGHVLYNLDFADIGINAMAIDRHARPILLLSGNEDDQRVEFLVRLRFDGSFDMAGLYATANASDDGEAIYGLALHPDGGVVAVGRAGEPALPQLLLAHYSDSDTFNPGFGNAGFVTAANIDGRAVVALPDGEIVVAGDRVSGVLRQFQLRYYNAAGSLALATTLAPPGRSTSTSALLAGRNNSLVLVGDAADAAGSDIALTRIIGRGKQDNTFGTGGWVITDLGQNEHTTAAVLMHDGRVIVVGRTQPGDSLAAARPFVARYLSNGQPDPIFGAGTGSMILDDVAGEATALAIQPDDKLLLAVTIPGDYPRVQLLRLLPDGRPDPSFGQDGTAPVSPAVDWRRANAMILDRSGFITVIGCSNDDNIVLSRMDRWGEPDRSFYGEEALLARYGGPSCAYAAAYDPDLDTIYVGGDNHEGDKSVAVGLIYGSGLPNSAPVIVGESFEASTTVPLSRAAPGLLANDRDPEGDRLRAELVRKPMHGSLELRPDGSFSYTATAGFSGSDSFVYRVSDGMAYSATMPVTITVRAELPDPDPTPKPNPTPDPDPIPTSFRIFLPLLRR